MTKFEIQRMLGNKRWPIRNGLYFPDGTVVLLNVQMPWETATRTVSVTVSKTIAIDDIEEIKEEQMTHFFWNNEQSYADLNLRVSAGEGSWGSEGLVAVTQISTGEFVWLLYLDCSNPFESVSLVNGVVTAVSNLEHIWCLPVAHPEAMTVALSQRDMTQQ
jgi:hypothetical protein